MPPRPQLAALVASALCVVGAYILGGYEGWWLVAAYALGVLGVVFAAILLLREIRR